MPSPRTLLTLATILATTTVGAPHARAQKLDPDGGLVEAEVVGLVSGPNHSNTQAVVLRSKTPPLTDLEIWIGPTEAMTIQLRVLGRRYPRPLTHDLLQTVLDKTGAEVVRVEVHSVRAATFIGRIHLAHAGKTHVIDARASDSIAVALGSSAPILVSKSVFMKAGRQVGADEPVRVEPPPSTKL